MYPVLCSALKILEWKMQSFNSLNLWIRGRKRHQAITVLCDKHHDKDKCQIHKRNWLMLFDKIVLKELMSKLELKDWLTLYQKKKAHMKGTDQEGCAWCAKNTPKHWGQVWDPRQNLYVILRHLFCTVPEMREAYFKL